MTGNEAALLFVPGDRPDRFAKAAAAGADQIILDLEDAVDPTNKDHARAHVREWLAGRRAIVRINAAGTPWYAADLRLVEESKCLVMLPKTVDSAGVSEIASLAAGVYPLIETAAGVLNAAAVCAVPGVVRPVFGSVDLATELGVDEADYDALSLARQHLVLAAAAAGVGAPIDGVTTALHDEDALLEDIRRAKRLGFTGKLCIHPRQVDAVVSAFRPGEEQISWARRVLAASGGSAVQVDGKMVDRPVVARAQAILDRTGPDDRP